MNVIGSTREEKKFKNLETFWSEKRGKVKKQSNAGYSNDTSRMNPSVNKQNLRLKEVRHAGSQETTKEIRGDSALGSKSIFYDPDWNPKGEAPVGFKNVPYNPLTFSRRNDQVQRELAGLTDITPPSSASTSRSK